MFPIAIFNSIYPDIIADSRVRAYALTLPIEIMYLTGCRPADVIDQTQWHLASGNTVIFTPKKGNAPRTFVDADLYTKVETLKVEIESYGTMLSYRRLHTFIKPYLVSSMNLYDEKKTVTYIFRYAYIQNRLNEGLTLAQLRTTLGHQYLTSTLSYFLNVN